jgi:hypothetical protein
LEGVPDRFEVLRRARAVNDEACREAAAFLEAVAPSLEAVLTPMGQASRFRRNLQETWGLKYAVRPGDGRPDYFEAGAAIDTQAAQLFIWLWFRPRALTVEVARGLGETGVAAKREGGCIYLPGLPLLSPGDAGEDFDIAPVLLAFQNQVGGLTPALLVRAARAASRTE